MDLKANQGAMLPQPGTSTRQTEVSLHFDMLLKSISELEQMIATLGSRLEPVIRKSEPVENVKDPSEQPQTTLANQIYGVRKRIDILNQALAYLNSHLEI